jgi:hypothetical protein
MFLTRISPLRPLGALCVLLALLAGACTPAAPYQPIPSEAIALPEGADLHLDIRHGAVALVFGDYPALGVSGEVRAAQADALEMVSEGSPVLIRFAPQRGFLAPQDPAPLRLVLTLPRSTRVVFETFDADLSLSGEGGRVEVTTTSGDVLLAGFSGEAVITANRGDVTIQESRGALSVFANYGFVHFTDAHGTISVVSILGEVRYTGRPEAGDDFSFQTDHARVGVSLPPDADLAVSLQSSSADVICVAAGLAETSRTCQGVLGEGGASLNVRTVSGPVTLRLDPLLD